MEKTHIYDRIQRCGSCRFFRWDGDTYEDDPDQIYGICFRFPPVYVRNNESDVVPYQWKQPAVDPELDECGEWDFR